MKFLIDEDLPRSTSNLFLSFILNLIESFLSDKKLTANISGKLAIVEPWRVRIREA